MSGFFQDSPAGSSCGILPCKFFLEWRKRARESIYTEPRCSHTFHFIFKLDPR